MGKFDDLHGVLGGLGGQYPDTLLDDLRNAYDEDMSVPTARIAELTEELAGANARENTLKARLYDAVNAGPVASDGDNKVIPVTNQVEEDDDDEVITIDDLFGKDD